MRCYCLAFALLTAPACGKSEPAPAPTTQAPPTTSAPTTDHDHGMDHGVTGHGHGAPHGGEVKSIGAYHLEAVPTKAGLLLFPLDSDEKELPLDGVSAKLTFVADGEEPVESTLEPMGNHLHGMVALDGPWKAAVTVTIKGEAFAVRYEGTGLQTAGMAASAGHGEHGDHDHGMPVMKLSDKVVVRIGNEAITPGQETTLRLAFADGDTLVTDFEVTHERQIHCFIVSEDLSFYAHVHPVAGDAGAWTLPFTFPAAGAYRVYADFKSTRLGPIVTMATLTVPGTPPPAVALVADRERTKTFDGLKVTISTVPQALGVGDAIITYTLADAATDQPVTDLEPYLGAMAHLFILNQDLASMAHAHPRGPEVTADSRGGPTVDLHTQLPKPGLYKLWGQFKRGDKVITTDWVLEVK